MKVLSTWRYRTGSQIPGNHVQLGSEREVQICLASQANPGFIHPLPKRNGTLTIYANPPWILGPVASFQSLLLSSSS